MKNRIIQWSGFLFLFLFTLSLAQNVSAATLYKNGKSLKTGTTAVNWFDERNLYTFKYDGESVYLGYIEVTRANKNESSSSNAVDFSLCEDTGYIEDFDLEYYTVGDNMFAYIFLGNEELKYGHKYKFKVTGVADNEYKIKYNIEKYKGYSESIKISTKLNMKIGDIKRINVANTYPYGSYPVVKWTSSNSKIADVDQFGYVTAKKKGNCVITAKLNCGKQMKCKISVANPPAYINYYKCTMCRSDTEKLKIMYTTGKVKWTSSNKKIATVSSNGIVKAIGIGKCKITGTVGKKKYYCDIQVNRQNPDFGAVLTRYNTRDNYFVVKFENKSNKPVTICANSMRAEQDSYRIYDRELCFPYDKNITIPAKKAMEIPFHVKGSLTWYNKNTFTIIYYFNFDGKKYEGHVWNCDSVYKKSGKWYNTYWTIHNDWYRSWYYK